MFFIFYIFKLRRLTFFTAGGILIKAVVIEHFAKVHHRLMLMLMKLSLYFCIIAKELFIIKKRF